MRRHVRIVSALLLILVLSTGSISIAIPIQPEGENNLEYLQFLMDLVQNYYIEEVDQETLLEGAYEGIFDVLDQHSVYFTPEEYKSFNENTEGSFGGIGISVTKDEKTDYIRVVSPIDDTPGKKAGILANDLIIKVDDVDMKGVTLEESVKIMRGEPGTPVTLTIQRGQEQPRILTFEIIRAVIEVHPVKVEVMDGNIGYMKITQFSEKAAEEVNAELRTFKDAEVAGLIIDLRNNPGGRLDQVVEIADDLLPAGDKIVQIDYRVYEDEIEVSRQAPVVEVPLIVLVNEGSASASEILAGALQDNDMAEVIGVQTYGKGTVQSVIPLSNGGGSKITVAEYYTANRNKVNGAGITPDFVVKMPGSDDAGDIDRFVPMIEQPGQGLGDIGLNVYGLQQRLNIAGYLVTVDGVFGNATREQLVRFQQAQQLQVTGVIDQATIDRLQDITTAVANAEGTDTQLEMAKQYMATLIGRK